MTDQYLNVTRIGNNLCVRGIDDAGVRFNEKIHYTPYAFLESNEESTYHNMFGVPLKRKEFGSMSDYSKFKRNCEDLDIDVYGMDNMPCQYMCDTYNTDFKLENARINFIDIENLMHDEDGNNHGIQTESTPYKITAITLYDTLHNRYHVFGDHHWENKDYTQHDIVYYHCDDEYDLLKKFIHYWVKNYPDIVTGWNTNGYDIPYLVNRITLVLGESWAKKLSPWGKIDAREFTNDHGKKSKEYKLLGISCVDYIQVYKKNKFHKQESYKLDFIAEAELGKGKLDFRNEGYKDLDDLYERNYQRYIDYNIRDVESNIEIDNKNKFLDIVIGIAHYALVNYDEVYSVLRCWDSIRHRYLMEHNIISSPRSRNQKNDKFEGAYVKEPIPGMYKWVMTFDLASLYPSIIMTCNIGDETLVKPEDLPEELYSLYNRNISQDILDGRITEKQHQALVDNNLTMAANGTFYRNTEQSVQSILSDDVLNKRRVFKNEMLRAKDEYERAKTKGVSESELKSINDNVVANKNNQLVVKVLANSLYGAMGNQYDRYFDLHLAEGVTLTGQTVIKWAENKVNEYLNGVLKTDNVMYCIYSDTDSIFVNLESMVDKLNVPDDKVIDFLDKVGDQINVKLKEFYDELGDILNSKNNRLSMKREVISSTSIFRTKKNYAMKVWDNEGVRYDDPDYKIMGMEVVRSTTPKYIRGKLKHVLTMILSDCSKRELMDYVEEVKKDYYAQTDIEKIAFPSGSNNFEKWRDPVTLYKPRVPIHVRAALIYNKYYAQDGEEIMEGDDLRYIYLTLPNPVNENVIGIKEELPGDLWKYIDWKTNFEKVFKKPVESLTKLLGWSMDNKSSLMGLVH